MLNAKDHLEALENRLYEQIRYHEGKVRQIREVLQSLKVVKPFAAGEDPSIKEFTRATSLVEGDRRGKARGTVRDAVLDWITRSEKAEFGTPDIVPYLREHYGWTERNVHSSVKSVLRRLVKTGQLVEADGGHSFIRAEHGFIRPEGKSVEK